MRKSDGEAQRKSSLSDCTWLERWVWILIFETFEIPNSFREPGSSLYFLYILIFLFSFFFIHIFFLYLFLSFFYYSPWTLNCIVPTSSPMLRCLLVLGQRGDRDKVDTRNIFPFGEILEIFNLGTILGSSLNWRSILTW
jgi:hypothetical protein